MVKFRFDVSVDLEELYHQADSESESIVIPASDVLKEVLAQYIRDAIGSWGGQFYPEDIMFSGNIKKVTATPRQFTMTLPEKAYYAELANKRRSSSMKEHYSNGTNKRSR